MATIPSDADRLVAAEIRAEIARQNISHDELAQRLGVSQPWVSRRLAGDTSFHLSDVVAIAQMLDVAVEQFTGVLDTSSP